MKILFFLLILPILRINANEVPLSLKWKKYQIPYNYILTNDLTQRGCSISSGQINEIKEKNKLDNLNNLKIGDYIYLPTCEREELYISYSDKYPKEELHRRIENSDFIVDWEKYTVEKGYVLSADLVELKKCNLIWSKQIIEFQKKNPHIKNVNVIQQNKEIYVQRCKKIIEENEAKEEKVGDEELTYLIEEDIRFDLYLGVSNYIDLAHLFGIGIRGNVYEATGFDLRVLSFGKNAIINAEFEYKDPSNYKKQYIISLGIINYTIDDEETKVKDSGSVYATYGYIFRPSKKAVFEIEGGMNISENFGYILSTSAMKKFNDNWAGVFIESRSLNTVQGKNKNLIIGGFKFSF